MEKKSDKTTSQEAAALKKNNEKLSIVIQELSTTLVSECKDNKRMLEAINILNKAFLQERSEKEKLRRENISLKITLAECELETLKCKEEITRDFQTGLFFRSEHSEKEIDSLISSAQRNNEKVALIYADIDDLKLTNDIHGHEVGDGMMRIVGKVFRDCLRSADLGYRWTRGDEFLLVIRFPTGNLDPTGIVEKIWIDRIEKKLSSAEYIVPIGLSMGYVIKDENETRDEAIKRANEKMREVKTRKNVGR